MSQEKHHIVSYKTHVFVLLALLVLTALSVAITRVELGPLNTAAALLIACIKATIVLAWFMHLKFESRFFTVMVSAVIILFLLVILVTFFDYSYR
ncbi:MAG: cytochrome C oxidase subunit IV family protein [Bacteroides sp.]|jgi:cytochrome c oxidase subunit 4|nr:cytochrome C oxidase subunit IV family protein [Bacteroides sp.]